MDFGFEKTWCNRFLLWAEPQIGKTGAFLQLLRNLIAFISRKEVEVCEPLLEGCDVWVDNELPFFPAWFFPEESAFGEKLRRYNDLLTGKYHGKVAALRLKERNGSKSLDVFKRVDFEAGGSTFCRRAHAIDESQNFLSLEECVNWDGFFESR